MSFEHAQWDCIQSYLSRPSNCFSSEPLKLDDRPSGSQLFGSCSLARPCLQLVFNPSSVAQAKILGVTDDSWLSQTLLPSHHQVLLTRVRAHACIFLLECSEKHPGGGVFHVALSLPCQGFLSPGRWCCLTLLLYARGCLSIHAGTS